MNFLGYAQYRAEVDAALFELLGFLTEEHGVEDDTVAYDIDLSMLEYT